MRTPAPAPILTHEDDESALSVREAPGGYELSIARSGLKTPYRLVAARERLADFAERLVAALDAKRRLVEVDGPGDGKITLRATVAPGEDGELLLLMLARPGGGDEAEMEYVRFASRDQMADFAEALLGLGA
jgi:hypothetical protein